MATWDAPCRLRLPVQCPVGAAGAAGVPGCMHGGYMVHTGVYMGTYMGAYLGAFPDTLFTGFAKSLLRQCATALNFQFYAEVPKSVIFGCPKVSYFGCPKVSYFGCQTSRHFRVKYTKIDCYTALHRPDMSNL